MHNGARRGFIAWPFALMFGGLVWGVLQSSRPPVGRPVHSANLGPWEVYESDDGRLPVKGFLFGYLPYPETTQIPT